MKTFAKIKNSTPVKTAESMFTSKYFPFITALITLLCYYLGWDIVLIYYICLTGIFITVFCDDVTPVVTLFLFMNVIVSLKNTPSMTMGHSDYYLKAEIYVQIIVLVALFICAGIFRIATTAAKKQFRLTPMFFGLTAFCAALLLNGLFAKNYTPKNLLFGFILTVLLLGIFSAVKDNVKLNSDSYDQIAYAFVALSALLLVELAVAYLTTEGLFVDGVIARSRLVFGWGVYNTYGLLIVMCLPAVIYLAGKKNFGYLYTLYSCIVFVAAFLSCSRQAMLGAVIVYPLSVIMLFVKGKNRKANAIILSAAAAVGIVVLGICHEAVERFFKVIFDNMFVDGKPDGSGRIRLLREAIAYFIKAPVFGSGFFVEFSYYPDNGLDFIPMMCHNTVCEILSACGIVGLAAYTAHRVLTVMCFLKNITPERTFIAGALLVIIILSLLDNHLFNVFPTLVYGALIAVLDADKTEKEKKNK